LGNSAEQSTKGGVIAVGEALNSASPKRLASPDQGQRSRWS
jgi:hypothetical protein